MAIKKVIEGAVAGANIGGAMGSLVRGETVIGKIAKTVKGMAGPLPVKPPRVSEILSKGIKGLAKPSFKIK